MDQFIKQENAKTDKELKQLAKMFESMKPSSAAPIFMAMEASVLLALLQHMKSNKTSAILAELPPQKAAKITEVMTYLAEGRREVV